MNLSLYNENLERVYTFIGGWQSLLWNEGYNSVESFSLEVGKSDKMRQLLKVDRFLVRSDRQTVMVIKSVEESKDSIVATGKQAARCFDDVVFLGTIRKGDNIATAIREAYESTSKMDRFNVANVVIDEDSTIQKSKASILELCKKICQPSEVGFRTILNDSKISLVLYKPIGFLPVAYFSENYGNLQLNKIDTSTESVKNIAYVAGTGVGEDRIIEKVDLSNGNPPRELFVDAKSESMEEEETEEHYRQRLRNLGVEKLNECVAGFSVDFSISTSKFGKTFDLGDIVSISLPGYGIQYIARITKFSQKFQNNKKSTTITVGDLVLRR